MWMAIAVPLLVGGLALALQQVEERLDRVVVAKPRARRAPRGCPAPRQVRMATGGPAWPTGPPGLPRTTSPVPVGRSAVTGA
jgi:hypothetical protein